VLAILLIASSILVGAWLEANQTQDSDDLDDPDDPDESDDAGVPDNLDSPDGTRP
jgi:hypothetical protein